MAVPNIESLLKINVIQRKILTKSVYLSHLAAQLLTTPVEPSPILAKTFFRNISNLRTVLKNYFKSFAKPQTQGKNANPSPKIKFLAIPETLCSKNPITQSLHQASEKSFSAKQKDTNSNLARSESPRKKTPVSSSPLAYQPRNTTTERERVILRSDLRSKEPVNMEADTQQLKTQQMQITQLVGHNIHQNPISHQNLIQQIHLKYIKMTIPCNCNPQTTPYASVICNQHAHHAKKQTLHTFCQLQISTSSTQNNLPTAN